MLIGFMLKVIVTIKAMHRLFKLQKSYVLFGLWIAEKPKWCSM